MSDSADPKRIWSPGTLQAQGRWLRMAYSDQYLGMVGFPNQYSFRTHTDANLVLSRDPGPADLLLAPLTFMPYIFPELWSQRRDKPFRWFYGRAAGLPQSSGSYALR